MRQRNEGPIELPEEREARIHEAEKEELLEFLEEFHVEEQIIEKVLLGDYEMVVDEKDKSVTIRNKNGDIMQFANFGGMSPEQVERFERDAQQFLVTQKLLKKSNEEKPL